MAIYDNITPLGPVEPVEMAAAGYELCYECRGGRVCWSCEGRGRFDDSICHECYGFRWCILCRGSGQLSAGTDAEARRAGQVAAGSTPSTKILRYVGAFREFDLEDRSDAPPLAEYRGRRSGEHKAEVVKYLLSGKPMVVSPGGSVPDVFDPTRKATTRSILTDGIHAWSKLLAYYVDIYDVLLPLDFEDHMEKLDWNVPNEIDVSTLSLPTGSS